MGEGEDYLLRTRKQRIKFAEFRAVESQRMERNSGRLTLMLKQRNTHFLRCLCGVSSTLPLCPFLIPIFKF